MAIQYPHPLDVYGDSPQLDNVEMFGNEKLITSFILFRYQIKVSYGIHYYMKSIKAPH